MQQRNGASVARKHLNTQLLVHLLKWFKMHHILYHMPKNRFVVDHRDPANKVPIFKALVTDAFSNLR